MKWGDMTVGVHRKSRIPAFLSKWFGRNRDQAIPEPEDDYQWPGPAWLTSCDGAYAYSEELLLAPEHPYKWVNCVICFETPGEHAIRLVALFDPRVKHTPTWQIHVRGYLICAFHGLPDGNTLVQLAHKRDYPNCDCRLAVAEAIPAMSHFAGNGGFIA